ncbi:hypothetical protein ABK040_014773 [Willaertia magna]
MIHFSSSGSSGKNLSGILFIALTVIFLLVTNYSHHIVALDDNVVLRQQTERRILFSVQSASITEFSYGALSRFISIAQALLRDSSFPTIEKKNSWKIGWMVGKHYRNYLESYLKKYLPQCYNNDNNASEPSCFEFYETETIPLVMSFVPAFISYKIMKTPSLVAPSSIPSSLAEDIYKTDKSRTLKLFGNIYWSWVSMGFARESILRQLILEQLEIYSKFKPDAIFSEIDLAVYHSSHLAKIPIIETFGSSLIGGKHTKTAYWINSISYNILSDFSPYPINFQRQQTIDDLMFLRTNLKMVPSIEELELPQLQQLENVSFIGYLFPTSPKDLIKENEEDKYANQRVIFTYFGKMSLSFDIVKEVMPEFCLELNNHEKRNNPTNYIPYHCYVAETGVDKTFTVKNYTHFHHYINGNEIIPKAEAIFTHGGSNTIHQSLYYGIPLIIHAGYFYERTFNGLMVENQKGGILLEPGTFNVETLLSIFTNKNTMNEIKQGAKLLSTKLKEKRGPHKMVEDVDIWLNKMDSKEKEKTIKHLDSVVLPRVRKQQEFFKNMGEWNIYKRDVGDKIFTLIAAVVSLIAVFLTITLKFMCFSSKSKKLQ